MGDSITEGAVAALTKSPGDAVEAARWSRRSKPTR